MPLYVALYPIAADDSPTTRDYLAGLEGQRFAAIDRFFAREAARYHLGLDTPLKIRLRPALDAVPPQREPTAGRLATALFTLKLRAWAFLHSGHAHEPEDIRLFVLYHDPERTPAVPHSLGLRKGLIGVVYAFATPRMDGANEVVIAHELLHTLGATDKYDPDSDAPRFPDGYGDARQQPLFPQHYAELMAGRRVISPTRWLQAESLDEVLIGPSSAREIHWPEHPEAPPAERPEALRAPPLETRAARCPAQPSAARTAACSSGWEAASTERDSRPIGSPSRSVNVPPASVTIATQAAISRMLMSVSTTTSI